MKYIKQYSPPIPHLLQAQQALALLYAKVAGRPGTGSYPAPLPSPTTQPEFGLLKTTQPEFGLLNFVYLMLKH